jgi:hypothetical protein
MKRLNHIALALGSVVALVAVAAADTKPMTKVTAGAAAKLPATANRAVPGAAIKAAMSSGQTGVFRSSTIRLSGEAAVETLALVENGRVVDLHARQGGTFLTRRPGSGIRALPAATFRTLIGYGIDAPITDPARRAAFLAAARPATSGTSGQSAPPPCPADFAAAPPHRQQLLLNNPAYATCSLSAQRVRSPVQLAARGFIEVFGIPAAAASDWSMIFFEAGTDPFFSNWGFEYVPDEYVAVNIGGARGVWANTGG